jgi:chloramphenicol-sensitive protein RarD
MWGVFPLYWPLLEPAGAVEILAHRVCWSLVTMLALTVSLRRTAQLRAILRSPRLLALLTVASVVIGLNWGGFIYGVNNHRVVEVSLGYFINPLVTVLLGVVVLGERLRPLQWVAIGIATLAVVGLTVDYGHPPWIAFLLAGSFGTYGLAKKKADVEAVESLTFETMVLFPVALGYLVWLWADGSANFGAHGVPHALLLTTTGLVTAVPLICFGAAAIRVSMTTIGLLQYLAPTIQFALGLVVFHENMTPVKWLGFAFVWLALALFTTEALRHRGRQLRLAAEASAI